ncbi:hypothetical protein [Candidatus Palauibacter sp.]|uniref:hypothetical protein n=1 Tax=Candidatus Palauibacter sp. TaxID=3101350 RepID=UPI003B019357
MDLRMLRVTNISDIPFLTALANSLDAALHRGLDMARRIGWAGEGHHWRMGRVHRVAYQQHDLQSEPTEPDRFSKGLAPVTKLLHAVVIRLTELDVVAARRFVDSWRSWSSPIHARLWAATAQSSSLVSIAEIGAFLLGLVDRHFWLSWESPEIADLRAKRFVRLDDETRTRLSERLYGLPPVELVADTLRAGEEEASTARIWWAVRELRRIREAGAGLSADAESWLETAVREFPEFATRSIEHLFSGLQTSSWRAPIPDDSYGVLAGVNRLHALERALSARTGRNGGQRMGARAWLKLPGNVQLVLTDLESGEIDLGSFPSLLNDLFAIHAEAANGDDETRGESAEDVGRLLELLEVLPEGTLPAAIRGAAEWMAAWTREMIRHPSLREVWLRIWPMAVTAAHGEDSIYVTPMPPPDESDADRARESLLNDAVTTPVGKMVGTFLAACVQVEPSIEPFTSGSDLRRMRDAMVAVTGRSETIVRYRLLQHVSWFLEADHDWTEDYLIGPLQEPDAIAHELWPAIGRQVASIDVLKILGSRIIQQAANPDLPRDTRCSLASNVVLAWLNASLNDREPPVARTDVQQMLRGVDDEVRAASARAVVWFMQDSHDDDEGHACETVIRSAIRPFFENVWPQERSLATPSVTEALATLPVAASESFAEAVDIIERFLVPFSCWDMGMYHLYEDDNDPNRFAVVDDEAKGHALLRLLDNTVGYSEDAIVPYDLSYALDHIRSAAPSAAQLPSFRRLGATSRR